MPDDERIRLPDPALWVDAYDPDSSGGFPIDRRPGAVADEAGFRLPVGARRRVTIELRGTRAVVDVDGEKEKIELSCCPEELVVGAPKWRESRTAKGTGEHIIRYVRIGRI